jgi:hypothetical protein
MALDCGFDAAADDRLAASFEGEAIFLSNDDGAALFFFSFFLCSVAANSSCLALSRLGRSNLNSLSLSINSSACCFFMNCIEV